jgi:chemotaxis protein MotB
MPAGELGKLPNEVSIEGHTDSKPYAGMRDYGNWELSSDRANAARRLMQQKGVGLNQVSQVRGFADQKLRKADNPLDSSNRRITLIVQYIVKDLDEDSTKPGDVPEGAKPAEDKPSPSHPPDH